jgi:hypothetical protein
LCAAVVEVHLKKVAEGEKGKKGGQIKPVLLLLLRRAEYCCCCCGSCTAAAVVVPAGEE